jgi:hypothetical protein
VAPRRRRSEFVMEFVAVVDEATAFLEVPGPGVTAPERPEVVGREVLVVVVRPGVAVVGRECEVPGRAGVLEA